MRRLIPALLVLAVLLIAPALAGGDVLKTYKSRFKPDAFLSEREAVIDELARVGKPKALAALQHCIKVSKKGMDARLDEAEDVRGDYMKALKEYQEKFEKFAAQAVKRGEKRPTKHPSWPIYHEVNKLNADMEYAEKQAADWRALIERAHDKHGELVAGLPAADQTKIRDKWVKGPLADRDWTVRAAQWDLVGRVPTEWAYEMLVGAITTEPDPRVLVRVIDGFVGRESEGTTPVVLALLDDVRWVIRAAAIAVIEKTPSKAGVDAIVERIQVEDGRIIDDCSRAAVEGKETRAEKAKEELKRSVLGLEDGSTFNIVFFSADVRVWKKEMVIADAETRRAAIEYIDQVAVDGGTATYDALKAAFGLGDVGKGKKRGADPDGDSKVDTIILLSDGLPSVGHTTNPDQIRADVIDWNKARRIAVHTVAFGKDADLKFMMGLATDTGGTHVAK